MPLIRKLVLTVAAIILIVIATRSLGWHNQYVINQFLELTIILVLIITSLFIMEKPE